MDYDDVYQALVKLEKPFHNITNILDGFILEQLVQQEFAFSISEAQFRESRKFMKDFKDADCLILIAERMKTNYQSFWHYIFHSSATLQKEEEELASLDRLISEKKESLRQQAGPLMGLYSSSAHQFSDSERLYGFLQESLPFSLSVSTDKHYGITSKGKEAKSVLLEAGVLDDSWFSRSEFDSSFYSLLSQIVDNYKKRNYVPNQVWDTKISANPGPFSAVIKCLKQTANFTIKNCSSVKDYDYCNSQKEWFGRMRNFLAQFSFEENIDCLISALGDNNEIVSELIGSNLINTFYSSSESWEGGGGSSVMYQVAYETTTYTRELTYSVLSPIAEGARDALMQLKEHLQEPVLVGKIDNSLREYEQRTKPPKTITITHEDSDSTTELTGQHSHCA